jgi:hypothetical protein
MLQRWARGIPAIESELVLFKIVDCIDNPLLGGAQFEVRAESMNFRRNLRLESVLHLPVEFLSGRQCGPGRLEPGMARHHLEVSCAYSKHHDVSGVLRTQERGSLCSFLLLVSFEQVDIEKWRVAADRCFRIAKAATGWGSAWQLDIQFLTAELLVGLLCPAGNLRQQFCEGVLPVRLNLSVRLLAVNQAQIDFKPLATASSSVSLISSSTTVPSGVLPR